MIIPINKNNVMFKKRIFGNSETNLKCFVENVFQSRSILRNLRQFEMKDQNILHHSNFFRFFSSKIELVINNMLYTKIRHSSFEYFGLSFLKIARLYHWKELS